MSDDYDYYDPSELPVCPHCMGAGDVPCHCGGDLCICDNDGYEMCPVCFGECEVTRERQRRYFENQRKNAEMMREIMERVK